MNRSLTRRALRAYDATAGHRRGAEIHSTVVFPPQAIHPLPEHRSPGPGFRPFAYGRWLGTIGPQLWDGDLVDGLLPSWDEPVGDCREVGQTWSAPAGQVWDGVRGPVAERDSFQQPSDSAARNDDTG